MADTRSKQPENEPTTPTRWHRRGVVGAAVAVPLLRMVRASHAQAAGNEVAVQNAAAQPTPLRGFGVCTHFGRADWDIDRLVALMKRMGVSVVRDEIYWSNVETEKGRYAIPERAERWLKAVSEAGIKVILILSYGNKLYESAEYPSGTDPEAFARFAAFMVRTLKSRGIVVAYEIWNEPNNFHFQKGYGGVWNGSNNSPWVEKFSRFVATVSAAIKKEDPSVPVITGGGVPPATVWMLRRFPECFQQVDGLTEHPYGYRNPSETIAFGGKANEERDGVSVADDQRSLLSLLSTLREEGRKSQNREMPLYITEIGYSTYREQKKTSLYAGFSESAQAAYHARSLVMGLASGARFWCLYDLFSDGNDSQEPEHNFGLVRRDYSPKPVVGAVERVARLLGADWQYLAQSPGKLEVDFGNPTSRDRWSKTAADGNIAITGPQSYWFRTSQGIIAFVWKAGRYNTEMTPPLGTVTLTGASSATVTYLINGETRTVENGPVLVPIGAEPVAIFWPKKAG